MKYLKRALFDRDFRLVDFIVFMFIFNLAEIFIYYNEIELLSVIVLTYIVAGILFIGYWKVCMGDIIKYRHLITKYDFIKEVGHDMMPPEFCGSIHVSKLGVRTYFSDNVNKDGVAKIMKQTAKHILGEIEDKDLDLIKRADRK